MKVTDVFAIFGGLLVLVGIGYIIYGLIAGKGSGGGGNKPLTLQNIDNETKKRMMLYMNLDFILSAFDDDINNCFRSSEETPQPKICNLTVDDKTYEIILSNYKLYSFANYHINSSTDENMLIYLFDKITGSSSSSVYIVDCNGYKCEKYLYHYDPIKNRAYFASNNQ